jgi:hypothetical protein
MTQRLSAARLERMRTVLGGYVDRGETPGLVALANPTSPVRGVEVSKVGHFFIKVGTTFR